METILKTADLEQLLQVWDAVPEGVKRYPVCQSSAFRGLIIAKAAPSMEALERAKKALETPEAEGVTVDTADLKRLIGVHEDIGQAESAYEYTQDGYRLFRTQAENIRSARNNVNAVERLREALRRACDAAESAPAPEAKDTPEPKKARTGRKKA